MAVQIAFKAGRFDRIALRFEQPDEAVITDRRGGEGVIPCAVAVAQFRRPAGEDHDRAKGKNRNGDQDCDRADCERGCAALRIVTHAQPSPKAKSS